MKKNSSALIVAGVIVAAPVAAQGPPQGPGPCGVPDADVRAEVVELLTAPERASTRELMQLTGLSVADLVELGGERDDTRVCARLLATLPSGIRVEGAHAPLAATMYRVGERYIVALRSTPVLEPNPQFRWGDQTLSYTLDFQAIAGVAAR